MNQLFNNNNYSKINVILIGSTDHYTKSKSLCEKIGKLLATKYNDKIQLNTGAVVGIPESIAQSFYDITKSHINHYRPEEQWEKDDYIKTPGQFIIKGKTNEERRIKLSTDIDNSIFISLEGGGGTAHELETALKYNHKIIAIKSTGGASAKFFDKYIKHDPLWELAFNDNIDYKDKNFPDINSNEEVDESSIESILLYVEYKLNKYIEEINNEITIKNYKNNYININKTNFHYILLGCSIFLTTTNMCLYHLQK